MSVDAINATAAAGIDPSRTKIAGAIKRAGFVAEAEEVGVDVFLFVDVEGMIVPFDGASILLKNFSG